MQPRQISPRKALVLRISATPAAIQGLISRPSTGAPKKIRNSCSSSGVPWKIWMKAVDNARAPRAVGGARQRDEQAADRAADEGDQRQREGPLRRLEDEQEFGKAEGAHVSGGPDS